ncbi:hypothetical protein [Bacillus sp. B-jedd]|uniref:hypothetical protein n=1 Tax=Bacillus sp. B-jedd TaxID=1476857 RepID=UPI0005155688|nr:hypothetical protein [Bacillus sp. B-jedd]CEG25454.1 glycosyl hydrolase family protein [Bacillus sp. B-jedd]
MIIENKLTKKVYRRLVLRDLIFGGKSSMVWLPLYLLWWYIIYTITKIGQLKTNIPFFLGISILLVGMLVRVFIVYRKQMKKDWLFEAGSRVEIDSNQLAVVSSRGCHVFSLETLAKLIENKSWYFLYFEDKTIIPISKEALHSPGELIGNKHIRHAFWNWMAILFLAITIIGSYNTGKNAVNFNGALAWKINELKTDTRIKLKNDNFYEVRLEDIIDTIKAEMELEPNLMTDDLKIDFAKNGTIKEVYIFIYGFDENLKLQSSYTIFTDKQSGNRLRVHKQDWHGQGTAIYDDDNDLAIVIKMLNHIPVKKEVQAWSGDHFAVLYKGIRSWGIIHKDIHYIDETGTELPAAADHVNSGPTVSLYIPGKEDVITPKRYIYKPFFQEE